MDIDPGGIRLTESKFDVTDLVELQFTENAISARSSEIENIKNNKEQVSALKELEQITKKFDEVNGAYSDLESKRKKLEDIVPGREIIKTVYGIGYSLSEDLS